jgi:hypothetical protein
LGRTRNRKDAKLSLAAQHPVGVGTTWICPGFVDGSAANQSFRARPFRRQCRTLQLDSKTKAGAGAFLEHGRAARKARSPRFLAANAGFTAHYGPTFALRACEPRSLSAPRLRVEAVGHGEGRGMTSRFVFSGAVIFIGILGTVGFSATVSGAAVECVTEPKYDPPEGSHWYYHVDRATDRKCWYIMALAKETASVPTAHSQRTPAPSTPSQTGQRVKLPRSESEEAALFLEFLRWKALQGTEK